MAISRRDFLKLSALALSVSACQQTRMFVAPTQTVASILTTPSATAFVPQSPTHTPPFTDTPSPTSPDPTTTPSPTTEATPSPLSIVIDAHQDIAWNALEFGRDPLQSAFESRITESGTAVQNIMGVRTSAFPEWLVGRIGIIFATLFVMPLDRAYGGFTAMTYNSPQQAAEKARSQLSFYRQVAADEPQLKIIENRVDLQRVIDSWSRPEMIPIVGLVILMEGADPLLSPDDLSGWYEEGLRIIGPAWGATRYAGGTGAPGPLTDVGRKLLSAMASLGMVLDLSHLARQAYLQAVEDYAGIVIASHSNPYPFCPTDRGLEDDMIRLLAQRDGIMGIMPYNRYLVPGWQRGSPRDLVSLDTLAQAIDYVVQLTGSNRHVGIGSDFDGGFGLESIPDGMDSIADLGKIVPVLEKWGYAQKDLDAIMYGNWLRVLQNALPP